MLGVLVMFVRGGGGLKFSGVSKSRTGMVCNASIVEEGGVFSPRIGRGPGRLEGRRLGVSLSMSRFDGVGVPLRPRSFSGELER